MSGIISFTYTVIDGKTPPQKSYLTLFAANTGLLTTAELDEVVQETIQLIHPLASGGIVSCRIGFEADISSFLPSYAIPDPDSDTEEGAKFVFRPLDGDIRPSELRIATYKESLLVSGTRIPDIDDVNVSDFIDMIRNDLLAFSFDFAYTDSRGEPFTTYLGGEEDFRRRKRGR